MKAHFKKFLEDNMPRHPVQDGFVQTHAPKLFALGPTPQELPKAQSLIDIYLGGDLRRLYQDALERPEHYTKEQRDWLEAKIMNRPLAQELDQEQQTDALFRFMEATDTAAARKKLIGQVTAKAVDPADDPDTVMEGEPMAEPTFENQDFGDLIKII